MVSDKGVCLRLKILAGLWGKQAQTRDCRRCGEKRRNLGEFVRRFDWENRYRHWPVGLHLLCDGFQVVFFNFSKQSGPRDFEHAIGLVFVPIGEFEGVVNHLIFDLFKRDALIGNFDHQLIAVPVLLGQRVGGTDTDRDHFGGEHFGIVHDHRPLDGVAQFPDISGPVILSEQFC